jgi:hypothetical protein
VFFFNNLYRFSIHVIELGSFRFTQGLYSALNHATNKKKCVCIGYIRLIQDSFLNKVDFPFSVEIRLLVLKYFLLIKLCSFNIIV